MYINFLTWETAAVRIVIFYRMISGSRVYNHYQLVSVIVTPVMLWLFLCEQKKKFGFDIYCNKMHMYCLKIAEKILCIANAQEIIIPGFGFLTKSHQRKSSTLQYQ